MALIHCQAKFCAVLKAFPRAGQLSRQKSITIRVHQGFISDGTRNCNLRSPLSGLLIRDKDTICDCPSLRIWRTNSLVAVLCRRAKLLAKLSNDLLCPKVTSNSIHMSTYVYIIYNIFIIYMNICLAHIYII